LAWPKLLAARRRHLWKFEGTRGKDYVIATRTRVNARNPRNGFDLTARIIQSRTPFPASGPRLDRSGPPKAIFPILTAGTRRARHVPAPKIAAPLAPGAFRISRATGTRTAKARTPRFFNVLASRQVFEMENSDRYGRK